MDLYKILIRDNLILCVATVVAALIVPILTWIVSSGLKRKRCDTAIILNGNVTTNGKIRNIFTITEEEKNEDNAQEEEEGEGKEEKDGLISEKSRQENHIIKQNHCNNNFCDNIKIINCDNNNVFDLNSNDLVTDNENARNLAANETPLEKSSAVEVGLKPNDTVIEDKPDVVESNVSVLKTDEIQLEESSVHELIIDESDVVESNVLVLETDEIQLEESSVDELSIDELNAEIQAQLYTIEEFAAEEDVIEPNCSDIITDNEQSVIVLKSYGSIVNETPPEEPPVIAVKSIDLLAAQQPITNLSTSEEFAAIILSDENDLNWHKLVCVTTGSRVIKNQNLEPASVLIDCRAAVLARRAFLHYSYHELNALVNAINANNSNSELNSIYMPIPASNRFQLKPNLKLNLYLSTRPSDTEPILVNAFDGKEIILNSISDKISLWNEVGIQGSLLSHFIDNIYLNNIVIFADKCDNNNDNCEQIKQQILSIVNKTCDDKLASNWILSDTGDDTTELIDWSNGKAIGADEEIGHRLSRLSKRALNNCFREFLHLNQHNLRPNQSIPMMTYREWKECAPNYRIGKQLLQVRYAVQGRQWHSLPSEVDLFV